MESYSISDDDSVEEVLLHLEFEDFDNTEFLGSDKNDLNINIQNIMERNPICSIGEYLFQGQQEVNIGTQLYFKSSKNQDDIYVGQSIKKVSMKFLRLPGESSDNVNISAENEENRENNNNTGDP
mmetsp:Transcript_40839/g.41711  ORF Transcript_40839/g.41711 Transcript_40839/m.41711 type:complete len:125 (-) Transcript_40839:178-552(-)